MSKKEDNINRLPSLAEFLENALIPYETKDLEETCAICLCNYTQENGKAVKVISCGHPAHDFCIRPWFSSTSQKRGSCPTCRIDLFKPAPTPGLAVNALSLLGVQGLLRDSWERPPPLSLTDMDVGQMETLVTLRHERSGNILDAWESFLRDVESDLNFVDHWRWTSGVRELLREDAEWNRREAANIASNPAADHVRQNLLRVASDIEETTARGLICYHSCLKNETTIDLGYAKRQLESLCTRYSRTQGLQAFDDIQDRIVMAETRLDAGQDIANLAQLDAAYDTVAQLIRRIQELQDTMPRENTMAAGVDVMGALAEEFRESMIAP